MSRIAADVRYAFRMLRKAPGASAVAILSLALGIAITTTVFGWVRGVILEPLPGVAAADRLVTLETVTPSGTLIDSSFPDYQQFRDRTTTLSGVIAFKERPVGLGTARTAERVWALMVTGNYFDVLGVTPALGRFFEGDERSDAFDAHPVAVLGYAMWRARFGADPAIVGRTIALNRHPYTVIGVAPANFLGTINGLRFDVYVPLTTVASLTGTGPWLTNRANRPLYLFGRLKDGVTLSQARADMSSVAAATAREFPPTNSGISATVLPLAEARRGAQHELGPLLRILFAVGGIVLLIVCANVANLQLARSMTRRKEIAVRRGLGASRGRVLQQLFTEGAVLGGIAGLLGLLVSSWLVESLRFFLPFVVEYPIVLPTAMHRPELLFGVVASIAASVLFTIVPAWRSSAAGIVTAINVGRQTDDPRTSRISAVLVVSQIALAMIAVVSAALLVASFDRARRTNPGFDAHNVLLVGVNGSTAGYSRTDALRFLDRVVDRVRTVPGVREVALSEDVPLGLNGGSWEDLDIDGYVPGASESMKIYRNLVGPGYFGLMRIRFVSGRDFTDQDTRDTPIVAIVNETFARRYFAGSAAIGRRFTAYGRPVTIVGLVADSKYHELGEAAQPYFYVPLRQILNASTGVALHVRTAGDPLAAAAAVREAMRAIDPAVPSDLMTTLSDYTSGSWFAQQMAATLLSVLGALALMLSASGLYSLIAYGVARRRHEIGVRIALGATAGHIRQLVMGRGAKLTACGLGVGTVVAALVARGLSSLLFGVSPSDPRAFAAAAALLLGVSLAASYIPGRAATRVDPTAALRSE
jgi:predicted permease